MNDICKERQIQIDEISEQQLIQSLKCDDESRGFTKRSELSQSFDMVNVNLFQSKGDT